MKKMKTCVVTGGAGFIGSHLCKTLLEKGNKVICIDNFITGFPKNVQEFESNPNFTLMKHDINNSLHIEGKVDEVWNLASLASPVAYQKYPIETLMVGATGLKNMLGLALNHNAKFFHTSTSEVYGDPKEHPQKESYWGNVNPIGVRSCYDESKRFGEALVMAYHRQHNLDTKMVRIFNTYGPKMAAKDGRVVPNFILQALANQSITIYGDGKQTRSFIYIDDQIEGMLKLMASDYNLPVNIGNPEEHTILELAEKIKQLTNSESELIFKPLPQDDPLQRNPDISLAKELLGWEPKTSFEDGLKKTIDYFRDSV